MFSLIASVTRKSRSEREKKRFWWPESNLSPSHYKADVYLIAPFRHDQSGLENLDDNQRIHHEKASHSIIFVV